MKFTMKYSLVLVMMSFVVFSCDDYLDINENPNFPTDAPIEGLMTRTTLESARNTSRTAGTVSYFTQHFASPNEATSTDTHQPVSYGGTWASLYSVLSDLAEMDLKADDLDAPYYGGVAKILTAYNLGLLTSMFGDAPYSEALFAQTLNPPYDSSEDIYEVMLDMLDMGIQDLEQPSSAVVPAADDYIFNGDRASWIRTAYALKARYLNHYSKLGSYDPDAVLDAVDDAFENSNQDFQMNFFEGEGTGAENPWYRLAVNNAGLLLGGWLSEQFVDHLNGNIYGIVDPRIEFITEPVSIEADPRFGEYVGTPNGAGRGADPEQDVRAVLAVGSWYANEPTDPLQMATYAEMKFIEAEAALAAGQPGRAETAYEDGIRAHMEKLGVDPADIDDYWANPDVSTNIDLDKIMKEKYVAMFLIPEAWNDARRYDYAYEEFTIPANHNPDLGGQHIRLVRYPDSERQRNAAQIPDRGASDQLLGRIFWDAP
ncbi:MAG: SusD/RagB family nutrient-binding outer membrane lipoprotein [Cyclonatronaceae bacterium]